jgi:hypothetical protein
VLSDAPESAAGDTEGTTLSPRLSAGGRDLPGKLTKLMQTEGTALGVLMDAGENIPVIETILRGKGSKPIRPGIPAPSRGPGSGEENKSVQAPARIEAVETPGDEELSEPRPAASRSWLSLRYWLGGVVSLGLAIVLWVRHEGRGTRQPTT